MTTHGIAQFIKARPFIEVVEIDSAEMTRVEAVRILEEKNRLWPDVDISRSPDWKILTIFTNQF